VVEYKYRRSLDPYKNPNHLASMSTQWHALCIFGTFRFMRQTVTCKN